MTRPVLAAQLNRKLHRNSTETPQELHRNSTGQLPQEQELDRIAIDSSTKRLDRLRVETARDCSSQMHPTGRDCFGPPTLNRFWTCLCQRIDPKRGVARRGRAFIPDHSGLRAPFSADVRTRAADPGPRVTRLRHSPVARVALHDAPPGPFRLFRHAFGFRPVCVSAFPGGRALPRRGDPIGECRMAIGSERWTSAAVHWAG